MTEVERRRNYRIIERLLNKLRREDIARPRNITDYWLLKAIEANIFVLINSKKEN